MNPNISLKERMDILAAIDLLQTRLIKYESLTADDMLVIDRALSVIGILD